MTSAPNGWQFIGSNIKAAAAIWPVALLATQATAFAVPRPATVTSGWQQPLSRAAPVAKAQQGYCSVPFNTPQVVPAVPKGWQSIASAAPPRAVINGSALTFVVPPFSVPSGWQSQLSTAAPIAKPQVGSTFVPLKPVQIAATAQPNGWFGQLATAAKTATAQPSQATNFAAGAPPSNSVSQFGWYQPLSKSVGVANALPGNSFVPFNKAQTTPAPQGWCQPLSGAPPVARAQAGLSVVPFGLSPLAVSLSYDAGVSTPRVVYYQSMFSPLRPIAQASNTITGTGWHQPLSKPSPVVNAQPTQTTSFAVPANPNNSASQFGWYQQLSKAAPVAQTQLGSSFVPFNTAQTVAAPPQGWQAPLSLAASVAKPQQGAAFVPFNTAQVATGTPQGWQSQLSVAVKTASAVVTQPSFVVRPSPQYPLGWLRELSTAPLVAKVSYTNQPLVPRLTILPNTVTIDKWQQPLSKAVPVAQAQPGTSFLPLNATQIVSYQLTATGGIYHVAGGNVTLTYTHALWTPAVKVAEIWTGVAMQNETWIPATEQSELEIWTGAEVQNETWIPATKQAELWTDE